MKSKQKLIGSVIIAAAITIAALIGYFSSKPQKQMNDKDIFAQSSSEGNQNTKEIVVYINGEVKKPGVYRLSDASIMEDLLKASGGLTENADTDRLKTELNLAQKLKEGDHIYIGSKNDSNKPSQAGPSTLGIGNNKEKVNINRASKEELKSIPGIGDVTAQNIIDYREKNGDFKSLEDLKKIQRIGDKTLNKLKDKIDIR